MQLFIQMPDGLWRHVRNLYKTRSKHTQPMPGTKRAMHAHATHLKFFNENLSFFWKNENMMTDEGRNNQVASAPAILQRCPHGMLVTVCATHV